MIIKSTYKISELTGFEKITMLAIIRLYSKPLYKVLGADLAEETMIKLFDDGIVKLFEEERNNTMGYTLKVYNNSLKNYSNISEITPNDLLSLTKYLK